MLIGPWGQAPSREVSPLQAADADVSAGGDGEEMHEPSSAAAAFAGYFPDDGRPISVGNISSGVIPVICM